MTTREAKIRGRATASDSLPVRVSAAETQKALNAAMKRKNIKMDCSAWKRRATR